MEDNIDQNQSGPPLKDEEDKNEIEAPEQFIIENEKQESGPMEIKGQLDPSSVIDLVNQVPRMVKFS